MQKGEIVKTDMRVGNSHEGVSMLIEEIQDGLFKRKEGLIRGRMILKTGDVGQRVVECPMSRVVG